MKDIFANPIRGKRYKKADHKKGDLPYISSSAFNNGIDEYVSLIDGLKSYKNCITMANSGSVGSCFYHEYEFVPSDHVHMLWLKDRDLNREIALFLIAVLEQNKSNFHFNKEISNSTIDEIELILPVDDKNIPDWDYMEDYINSIIDYQGEKLLKIKAG